MDFGSKKGKRKDDEWSEEAQEQSVKTILLGMQCSSLPSSLTILVTGASGYIGQAAARALRHAGHRVYG